MLALFTTLTLADEDFSSERYCFSSPAKSLEAKRRFEAMQVPSDKVTLDEKCLVVQMRSHRRELIQKYLIGLYPEVRVEFSSAELKRDPCRLKIQKVKQKSNTTTSTDLDLAPTFESATHETDESEEIKIETIKDFAFVFGQEEVKGQCQFIRSDRYQITIRLQKHPVPLVPVNLPPGSVVTIAPPPANQETSFLETQVELRRGEKIELGNLIRDLKNKDQNIDINPSLKIETTSNSLSEKAFLSLD